MRTKQISVKEFLKAVKDACACEEGLESFNRKSGSVKQRLRKMCEVANRSNGLGREESGYLVWLTSGKEGSAEFLGFTISYTPEKGWYVE